MKNLKYLFPLYVALSCFLLGCEKSEPTSFSAKPAIVFDYGIANIKKINFSFLGSAAQEGEIRIPVHINGFAADTDRPFELEVITDTITDALATDYSIQSPVVRAGQLRDTLRLLVKRSPELDNKVLNLYLRVKSNAAFDRGVIERQYFQVSWSNQAIMPVWGVYFRTFISSAGSTKAYRIFVETTGLTNFTATEFRQYLQPGAEVLGKKFGDYIRNWNAANPNNILLHDDGAQAGRPIVPRY